MEEKKKSGKGLVIGIAVLLVLLAVIGGTVHLALNDPYAGTVSASAQPNTAVTKFMKAVLKGETVTLTREEVNGLLKEKISDMRAGEFALLELQCVSTDEEYAIFYAPISFYGLRLPISTQLEIGCNPGQEKLWAKVQSVHLGRLPIPSQWVMDAVKSMVPADVSVDGDTLSMPTAFFDENVLGGSVGLTVQDLSTTKEGFSVEASGNFDRLEDEILQKLGDFLTGDY